MATDELVPVFIPPLAAMLAQAEKVKGKPLSETEVVRIRDKAICVTMSADKAESMTQSRGYLDVNPENAWSDWHRLRVQMTGNGYLPKIILCIPGDHTFAKMATAVLKEENVEHDSRGRDGRMAEAFEASLFRVNPTLEAAELDAIRNHKSVFYVLSKNFTSQEAIPESTRFLRLGARLLGLGGIAMKCESAGIAHGRSRWIELAALSHSDPSAVFKAFVQYPIQSDDDLYTCGMHLLGKPDLIVSEQLLQSVFESSESYMAEGLELFERFAMYLLAECHADEFGSGHTFSLSDTSPRFRVLWEPCQGYDEDEFFFNPFGRWRFTPVK